MSDNARGVLMMCLSMALFTLNDVCMKAVMREMPMMQAIGLRGLFASLLLFLLGWRTGVLHLRFAPTSWRRLGLRTAAELVATLAFLAALHHLPIANVSAILQGLPLAITLVAALLFREPVGWRRIAAIVVGFLGVMLIIRPGAASFNIWSVVALVSMLCVVVRDLSTRYLGAEVQAVHVALAAAVAVMLMGFAGSLAQPWEAIAAENLLLLLFCSLSLVGGTLCVVSASRLGDIAVVSPFRYTALLWAIFLGWLVLDDLPDGLALLGAALIVGSGIFNLLREVQLRRAPAEGRGGA